MSHTDSITRLPRITPVTTVTVTEQDEMGAYTWSYNLDNKVVRNDVRAARQQKREMAQSGSGRKATLADIDAQEQVRDALLSPAYEGPVGTKTSPSEWLIGQIMPERMASRQEVEASRVKVEPVVPRTQTVAYLDRQAQEILRLKRERAARKNSTPSMAYMREIGFGGRYGVHLEG